MQRGSYANVQETCYANDCGAVQFKKVQNYSCKSFVSEICYWRRKLPWLRQGWICRNGSKLNFMLARWRSIKRRHKVAALSFVFLSKISLFITFFKNYHIHKNNFHDESETTRRNRSSILREPIKRFVCVTFLSLGRSISWLHFVPKKQVSPPAAGEVVWRSWVEQGLIYHEVCNLFLYCTVKFVWFWNGWSSD